MASALTFPCYEPAGDHAPQTFHLVSPTVKDLRFASAKSGHRGELLGGPPGPFLATPGPKARTRSRANTPDPCRIRNRRDASAARLINVLEEGREPHAFCGPVRDVL